jgi:hypothetical protein
MPNPPIDWPTIRFQFEHGASKNTLAGVHGVSRQAIIKRARQEGWITPLVTAPFETVTPPVTSQHTELTDAEIVQKALHALAVHLEGEGLIGLNQHKLFADSLSQYLKLKMLLPSKEPTASGIAAELLPYLDNDQLAELASLNARQEEILETARAAKLEQDTGIMSIRKKAMG